MNPTEMHQSNKTWTAADMIWKDMDSFSDLPPIEFYPMTEYTYQARKKIEVKFYKFDDLQNWDGHFDNVTEISREHYDIYMVNPDTNNYVLKNQSYLILFGIKDDEMSLRIGM